MKKDDASSKVPTVNGPEMQLYEFQSMDAFTDINNAHFVI